MTFAPGLAAVHATVQAMAINFSETVATFGTRIMGFDKAEVRACLQNLANDYEEARKEVDRLAARLKALEDGPTPGNQAPSGNPLSLQLEKVLASAHRIGEEVKAEASVAAGRILADAQEEAARLRAQAESDATALTRTATERLSELRGQIEEMTARRNDMIDMLERGVVELTVITRKLRAPVDSGAAAASDTATPESHAPAEKAGPRATKTDAALPIPAGPG
jgi:cell division septum initiation protein DivIVA